MKNRIVSIIVAVMFLIAGVVMIAGGVSGSDAELKDVTTLSASSMDDSFDYEIQEAYIFDNYATYEENGKPETYYLAVCFYDANDNLCMASLAMDPSDDIYDVVMDYLNDDTMYVGDLMLPVYASAGSFSSTSDVGEYFQEYANEIALYDYNPQVLWLQLHYMGGTLTDYEESAKSDSNASTIGGVVMLVLAVVFILLSTRAAKKQKEAEAARAAARAAYAAQQPVFTAAPQPQTSFKSPTYQAPAPEATAFCPTCGQKVKPGTAFCGSCGAKLQ